MLVYSNMCVSKAYFLVSCHSQDGYTNHCFFSKPGGKLI